MSADEQDAAILRIVKERAEAKRKRVLLESELRSAGKALQEVGGALQQLNVNSDHSYILKLFEKHAASIGSTRAAQMMREYSDIDREIRSLDAEAKTLGID